MKVVGSKGRCLGSASRHAYAMESVANVVPRRLVAPDVTASSGRKAAGTTPSFPQPLQVCQASAASASGVPHNSMSEGASGATTDQLAQLLKPLAGDYPDAVLTLLNWGDRLAEHLPDHEESVELIHQLIELKQDVLGPDHPSTLDSRGHLAGAKWCMGEDESPEALLDMLGARVRVLGPDHPDVLACMLWLAHSYQGEGDWVSAQGVYTQALEMSTRAFGADHEDTKWVHFQLHQAGKMLERRQWQEEQDESL